MQHHPPWIWSISRRSRLVGRPVPRGRYPMSSSGRVRAFPISSTGVRSSAYSGTNFAPTRDRGALKTRSVRLQTANSESTRIVTHSPALTERAGLQTWPSTSTLPALIASTDSPRVLKARTAHNHTSSLILMIVRLRSSEACGGTTRLQRRGFAAQSQRCSAAPRLG